MLTKGKEISVFLERYPAEDPGLASTLVTLDLHSSGVVTVYRILAHFTKSALLERLHGYDGRTADESNFVAQKLEQDGKIGFIEHWPSGGEAEGHWNGVFLSESPAENIDWACAGCGKKNTVTVAGKAGESVSVRCKFCPTVKVLTVAGEGQEARR